MAVVKRKVYDLEHWRRIYVLVSVKQPGLRKKKCKVTMNTLCAFPRNFTIRLIRI